MTAIDNATVFTSIIPAIDGGTARRRPDGAYSDDSIVVTIYELEGRLVRQSYDRRTTRTTYHYFG
jgi:hypothetical protein